MNWTWKRMHVLAATSVVDPVKRTTAAVADEAKVSRQRASITLKEMESYGFVERTRRAHNRAEWRPTTIGFTLLAQELGKRARVPSKDFLYRDPLRVVRTARRVRSRLLRVGWRWWQVAWALKKRTVTFSSEYYTSLVKRSTQKENVTTRTGGPRRRNRISYDIF